MIIDLQIASESKQLPTLAQLEQWAQLALQVPDAVAEITIRMVDDVEWVLPKFEVCTASVWGVDGRLKFRVRRCTTF